MSDVKHISGNLDFINGDILQKMTNGVVHVSKSSYATDTRTGLDKYSLIKPFATIQAAITASAAGDLVWIHPGTYDETLILKNNVNIHFDEGCTLSKNTSGNGSIAALISDNNAVCNCSITGHAALSWIDDGASSSFYAVWVRNLSSVIYLECDSIFVSDSNKLDKAIVLVSGGLTVKLPPIVSFFSSTGYITATAVLIYAVGSAGNGKLDITGRLIQTEFSSAVDAIAISGMSSAIIRGSISTSNTTYALNVNGNGLINSIFIEGSIRNDNGFGVLCEQANLTINGDPWSNAIQSGEKPLESSGNTTCNIKCVGSISGGGSTSVVILAGNAAKSLQVDGNIQGGSTGSYGLQIGGSVRKDIIINGNIEAVSADNGIFCSTNAAHKIHVTGYVSGQSAVSIAAAIAYLQIDGAHTTPYGDNIATYSDSGSVDGVSVNCNVLIKADILGNNNGVVITGGTTIINGNITVVGYGLVVPSGICTYTGILIAQAGGCYLGSSAATLTIMPGSSITGVGAAALFIGNTSVVKATDTEFISTAFSESAIVFDGTGTGEKLSLFDCEVTSPTDLYAVDFVVTTGKIARFKNTSFRIIGTATHAINSDTPGTASVLLLGCYGTKASVGGTGTVTKLVDVYTTDTDI